MDRVFAAFQYSMQGLSHVCMHERAFRQELIFTLCVIPVALFVTQKASYLLMLFAAHVFVLILELANTAVEAVCDEISTAHSLNVKIAKDCGSAAVFLGLVLCGSAWVYVVWMTYFV